MFSRCPSFVHWVPKWYSLSVQALFIECSSGVNNAFRKPSQAFVMHLWYFSDTSMIIYVKRNEKYHLCNILFISLIAKNLMQKWDFDTFFNEKHFSCVRKSSARRFGGYLLIIIPLQQSWLLRISNPQVLNRLWPFFTADFKSAGRLAGLSF